MRRRGGEEWTLQANWDAEDGVVMYREYEQYPTLLMVENTTRGPSIEGTLRAVPGTTLLRRVKAQRRSP